MRKIIVVPYDEIWANEFNRIKNHLLSVLCDVVISIEHVGSTSVAGLYAKPIIDIDIVIDIELFEAVKLNLYKIGYEHVGDLGIEGREVFKYENKPEFMEHHIYVCDKDAHELKRHVALRDYLRLHEDEREKYSQIKLEMAKKYPHDIDSYIMGKQHVILEIYEKCGLDVSYKSNEKV